MTSVSIFPPPKEIKVNNDGASFVINPQTKVVTSAEARSIAELFNELLSPALGYSLTVFEKASHQGDLPDGNIVSIDLDAAAHDHKEGYRLSVNNQNVHLTAPTPHGLVHGLQTIRQLLPPQIMSPHPATEIQWSIPCLTIKDAPSYLWRGMHLDVGRHMFSVPFIKKYIDLLSFYKFNVFHWHLTEDQGWRIEIKKHPKLTQVSAFRAETPIPSNREQGDGKPYGGFYTQDEIRDVVAYAQRRQVTIVPEIELPGHTVAVLAAYPELGCLGSGYQVRTTWGISDDVFCAGKEAVFTFLEEVLEEVLGLFPGTYVHIGGDECPKQRWKSCPDCQARIQQEKLKDEYELQSWFIRRIEKWLQQHDRRLIGWDEILEGGLSPSSTVMSWRDWRGTKPGIQAANEGNDVILTPTKHCYLDYYQSKDKDKEPPAIGGYLPLEQVYAFKLEHSDLLPEKRHHVLGGQCNVWTEYMQTSDQVDFMAYPRAIAMSEVLWTYPEIRDVERFKSRLVQHLPHLDALGVNFRPLAC